MGPLCSPQELTVASILGKLIVIPVMIIFSFSDYLSLLLWCQLLHQVCFSGCSLLVHAIFWVVFAWGWQRKGEHWVFGPNGGLWFLTIVDFIGKLGSKKAPPCL